MGGGDSDPVAIAEALVTFPEMPQDTPISEDISNYNEVCRRVKGAKQILVRNADTIHDFGGSRGQVGDSTEYARIKGLIVAEKTELNRRDGEYTGISSKYANLTQGSNFEDTMFRGLLPPQVTFTYNNEAGPFPSNPPQEYTRLVIHTDTVQDVNKAIQIRNDIYRFLWPDTVTGEYIPSEYEFKIMADVSPGNEIKKIATVTGDDRAVKMRIRVTPESVMDAGPTYNANNDKILPGFGEFTPSPLDDKWHPTPVYSLPYVGIKTRARTDYGVNNPKAFDVIFQTKQADGNGPTLVIPHDNHDSGPGVEYIARSAAGVPVGDIKAGMLPFYDIIRNGAYSDAATAVGFLRDGNLTSLGKNIGYDLKREGDQSQAIAVLMSYLKGENVILATQDRMLALFMILMGGPVIHVGTGKTTIYRGERLNLTDEQKRQVLIQDINDIIRPLVDDTAIHTITSLTTRCREYIDRTIEKYRSNTGKVLSIPYMLLMSSLADTLSGIDRFIASHAYISDRRTEVMGIVGDLSIKTLGELLDTRARIIGPVNELTLKITSVTSVIDTLKGIRVPFKKLDLGTYGYVDVPAINRLDKVLKRYISTAKSGFRSEKIFKDFKDTIVSNFGIVYSRLTDETRARLSSIETGLSSLTKTPDERVLGYLSVLAAPAVAPVPDDDVVSVATGDTADVPSSTAAAAARAGFEAAVAGTPPPDINTVTDITSPYEFCVRVVDVLYSTISPLIMLGKGRTEGVLGQRGGAKDRYNAQERTERRRREYHKGLSPEAGRTAREKASIQLRKKRVAESRENKRIVSYVFNEAEGILELKIMSLVDDLYVIDPREAELIRITLHLLKRFHRVFLERGSFRSLRMLHTMRGILVEGDPIFPYDNLYNIHTLPRVLNGLFEYCVRPSVHIATPNPFEDVDAFGRKTMPSQTKRRSRKCPRGTIRRKGYTTKRGVTVRSSCIKDRGLPGKGKRLFTLKKGGLSKHGYSLKYAREKRHAALNKARKELSHATLVRKINALAVLMKNTHPDYARRARADVKWLGKTRD